MATESRDRGRTLLDRLNASRPARIAIFWIAYALVTLVAGAIYVRILPSPDQSIFDYMSWLDLNGVPFYKGTFDMTWPGQLVFHELYIRLFGVHSWTARAGDFLILQAGVLALYIFLKRAGFARAAVAAALLYPIIYVTSGPWMAGHRDYTGIHFLIAAAIFALPCSSFVSSEVEARQSGKSSLGFAPDERWWYPVVSGLLIGYATMIRPTYLGFAPMLFLLALPNWKGGDGWVVAFIKQALLFAIGLAIAPAAFLLYGVATGMLHDWYIDAVRFVFDVYPVPEGRGRLLGLAVGTLGLFWWLSIAAGVGALLWLTSGKPRQGLWLLAAMILTALVSFYAQNKGFGYHLAGLIPIFLLLACAGVEAALRTPIMRSPIRNGLALIIVLLLLMGTSLRLLHARPTAPDYGRLEQDRSLKLDDSLELVRIIRAESTSADTLMQYGGEYHVAFLAERRSPTKYINTLAERLIRPGQPIFGQWLVDLDHDLQAKPPKFILVDQRVIPPGTGLPSTVPANGDPTLEIIRRRVNQGYGIRDQRGSATLLKRVDLPASQPNEGL